MSNASSSMHVYEEIDASSSSMQEMFACHNSTGAVSTTIHGRDIVEPDPTTRNVMEPRNMDDDTYLVDQLVSYATVWYSPYYGRFASCHKRSFTVGNVIKRIEEARTSATGCSKSGNSSYESGHGGGNKLGSKTRRCKNKEFKSENERLGNSIGIDEDESTNDILAGPAKEQHRVREVLGT
ncbi:unnamed protein product [Rotaria socialis]|uniref:Uncharacterized protein n=2 Tax=Rotaria socialis TaxID=392032 RepID=A0A820GQX9_9BILA|nr:unnamed protein product [Rotaria socialis]CAF3474773.1 unnamed protein product [Rotaria socialis]CAF4279297.1 unnamed protein product [Rotaria socialis]